MSRSKKRLNLWFTRMRDGGSVKAGVTIYYPWNDRTGVIWAAICPVPKAQPNYLVPTGNGRRIGRFLDARVSTCWIDHSNWLTMMASMTLMAGSTPWTGHRTLLAIRACSMWFVVDAGSGHVPRWKAQAGIPHNLHKKYQIRLLVNQGRLFPVLQLQRKPKPPIRKALSTAAYFLICRRVKSRSGIKLNMRRVWLSSRLNMRNNWR